MTGQGPAVPLDKHIYTSKDLYQKSRLRNNGAIQDSWVEILSWRITKSSICTCGHETQPPEERGSVRDMYWVYKAWNTIKRIMTEIEITGDKYDIQNTNTLALWNVNHAYQYHISYPAHYGTRWIKSSHTILGAIITSSYHHIITSSYHHIYIYRTRPSSEGLGE